MHENLIQNIVDSVQKEKISQKDVLYILRQITFDLIK